MLERHRYRQRLGVGLVPLAAFAVHQLRYLLAFGSEASHELAVQGHSYLHELTPWIMLAVALGVGGLLTRVARAWHTGDPGHDRDHGCRLAALWILTAVGLLAMYVGQEFLEGLLATGHPQGLQGIVGDGGLWAIPASIVIGGLLTLVIRGSRALVAHVAARRRRAAITVGRAPHVVIREHHVVLLARVAPLAAAGAGRAPPSLTRPI